VGQDEAVDAVSRAIRRSRVGISPKKRPVSFIFVGPTGVGKTELVKRLADDLFDSVDSLIRLDMSEYMEKHTVSKLIGSPPGYVGYDEAGQLTEKIRRRPYSVVLFDEIEKAHPDVLNILLQVLDDGRITDAQGRVVNFENTIIVMTSNAGSEGHVSSLGFGRTQQDQVKDKTMGALREFLRPEFINRVDEIITFNHLTKENFLGIADIMLEELKENLASRGLTIHWEDDLRQFLVEKAYSVTYGARNLRRTIQQELEDPISEAIIDSFETPISALRVQIIDGVVKLETT
jgi:ATP-dependent Clp protease ATP-binding subunit ClpA